MSEEQIEEMREMASIMTEAALLACEDIPLMPTDTSVCYNIPCHRCKETRLLVHKGYRKQREGRWKGAGLGDYLCSVCWSVYSGGDKYNYCPNCGSRMKEGR